MPNEKSVVLHGGAGNQLFQWAYGHYLSSLNHKIIYKFYEKPYSLKHASKSISSFIANCEHGVFLNVNLPAHKVLRTLADPTHSKNPIVKISGIVQNSMENTFLNQGFPKVGKLNLGYYQNFSYVYELREMLIAELTKSLFKNNESDFEKSLYGSEIIHIRQGDTMTSKNMSRVGVLSSNFYKKIPARTGTKRIVLTDDVSGAKKTLIGTNVDAFFGPDEMDVETTLRVMSKSSILYAANSTLAWWGGFLGQNSGAEVYIPEPFFLNVSPNPKDAFHYPGFILKESHFMRTSN
jgi:hypothetical protein